MSASLRPSGVRARSGVGNFRHSFRCTDRLYPVIWLTPSARYHAHLTRSLAKWSAKVAAVAPSALLPASRKKFSQAGSAMGGVKSVGTQIEEMLRSEWSTLLSRTRLRRCKGSRVTDERDSDEVGDDGLGEDVEVFDDTDFYQQLLRDVIDTKGGAGQVDWMASQRQKKSKKAVDTKASKGRKLRFVKIFFTIDFAYGYSPDIKFTRRYKISWSQFLTQRARGTKHRLTNCLPRCLERDLKGEIIVRMRWKKKNRRLGQPCSSLQMRLEDSRYLVR